jgi:hypothetical protein
VRRILDEQGVRLLSLAIGAVIAAQGVWAFVAPRSFFDTLATFDPYNAHFIRDIGTIQIGVGVAGIVGAARRADAVIVGLAGLATFQVLHVVSHAVDHDKGGRPGFDIPALSALALLTAAALVAAVRRARARD